MATVTELRQKASGLPGAAVALTVRRMPVRGRGAAVLCYHDVGTDPANVTDYYLEPGLLRAHIEWMREWGYTIAPLAEIVDRLTEGRELDGLVALTFDDALVGLGTDAGPVLDELRAPATVFVVADVLGVPPPFWPGAARTLTADELRAVTASGLVTVGSHTSTHVSLPDVDDTTRSRELAESRARLEQLIGTPVDLLAYPSGHHDAASEAAARAAGYRAAFTFSFGRVTGATDPFAIPRFCIGPMHDRLRLARQLARPAAAWPSA
ncbi:MAG: polysaccharide deacetylase family protein [Acidimicrobiia bacterium]